MASPALIIIAVVLVGLCLILSFVLEILTFIKNRQDKKKDKNRSDHEE